MSDIPFTTDEMRNILSEQDTTIATLRAEVERLRKDMGEARVVWGEARDCLLKKITEVSIENERLRAALEQIDHGWENPMDDKAYRALCRFMWETARAALAQEARDEN